MARTPLVPSQTFAEYLAGQAAATESESEAAANQAGRQFRGGATLSISGRR